MVQLSVYWLNLLICKLNVWGGGIPQENMGLTHCDKRLTSLAEFCHNYIDFRGRLTSLAESSCSLKGVPPCSSPL